MLCVHNFSRFPQPTELDLHAWQGRHPVELIGGVRFPAIGELPYLLTLGRPRFLLVPAAAGTRSSPALRAGEGQGQKTLDTGTAHPDNRTSQSGDTLRTFRVPGERTDAMSDTRPPHP